MVTKGLFPSPPLFYPFTPFGSQKRRREFVPQILNCDQGQIRAMQGGRGMKTKRIRLVSICLFFSRSTFTHKTWSPCAFIWQFRGFKYFFPFRFFLWVLCLHFLHLELWSKDEEGEKSFSPLKWSETNFFSRTENQLIFFSSEHQLFHIWQRWNRFLLAK